MGWRLAGRAGSALVVVIGLLGCKDLTGSGELPAGTPNPAIYNSASGAIGLRSAAIYSLGVALPNYIKEVALLTDELQDKNTGASAGMLLVDGGIVGDPLDERILPEGVPLPGSTPDAYGRLQNFRGTATLALHALATYDTAAADTAQQRFWRAELHAYIGYVEILLADLYCSGVPLSTIDFQGDFTYQPGSSTAQLYQTAAAEADSALALAGANDSVTYLARVLQGRAYLALGNYTAAKDDVTTVPTDFQYTVRFQNADAQKNASGEGNWLNNVGTVGDQDGGSGLPFHSSGDPRSADSVVCTPTGPKLLYSSNYCRADTLTYPKKYQTLLVSGGIVAFPVVDGIEARLIEAEAALQAGDATWLTILNTLRTSCTSASGCPTPAPAGTGGISGLPPLADPGSPSDRVTLLFQERAYWLFLTGHREGDLRRLIRQYGRLQRNVYPSGEYTAPGVGLYGNDINVPVPPGETANPAFHGCKDRNA